MRKATYELRRTSKSVSERSNTPRNPIRQKLPSLPAVAPMPAAGGQNSLHKNRTIGLFRSGKSAPGTLPAKLKGPTMLTSTLEIIRAALKADATVSAAERTRLLALLRNGGAPGHPPTAPPDTSPRILRRAEVARRLAVSTRTVDDLPLRKIKLPGRVRAAGFLEPDVNALLGSISQ